MDRRVARGRAAACAGIAVLAFSLTAAGDVAGAPRPSHTAPQGSHAAPRAPHGHTIYQSPDLWATIDVCSPGDQPHTIGVRGSMPGSGLASETMYMRFQLQYLSADAHWLNVGADADSGFLAVGKSTFKARQSGRNFTLDVQAGSRYVVRGVVTFEWRRRNHVVRNAQKATTAGHLAFAGADPAGYSAGACSLS